MEISILPVLTPANGTEYPEWHTYYEKVYGHSVTDIINLNTFTWFYWFSPLGSIKVMILPQPNLTVPLNTPFIFQWNGPSPELKFAKIGFFVRRELDVSILSKPILEVQRTDKSIIEERGVAWFYLTIGSGFYLESCNDIKIVKNRAAVSTSFCDIRPYITMNNLNINILIFTETEVNYKTGLIEVIYRTENPTMLGNDADIPMFHGGKRYKQTYDPIHRCLTA